MQRMVMLIFAVMSVVVLSTPVLAHRPYYSTVAKISLPNGEVGEVRLINGDGIFFTDPVRPLLVDAAGRLLARGQRTHSIAVSCDEKHRCLIVDLWKERIYDFEPTSFRQGPQQPTVEDGMRTDDWDLERGEESWGFTMREASSSEMTTVNLTFAKESWLGLLIIAVLSGFGALSLVPFHLDVEARWTRIAVRGILFILGLGFFLFVIALTFWFSMLAGFPFMLWLIPVITGAGLVWITTALIRWRFHRARGVNYQGQFTP